MAEAPSLYDLLQVSPAACKEVVEAAYRALQKRAHPDVGGSAALSRALNEARRVLVDPDLRAAYDAQQRAHGPVLRAEGYLAPSYLEVCYVLCPRCGTKNRVASVDALQAGRCGRCNRPYRPRLRARPVPPKADDRSPRGSVASGFERFYGWFRVGVASEATP